MGGLTALLGHVPTVDDVKSALTLRNLNYGKYGIFLMMGHAGLISSTVLTDSPSPASALKIERLTIRQLADNYLGFRV